MSAVAAALLLLVWHLFTVVYNVYEATKISSRSRMVVVTVYGVVITWALVASGAMDSIRLGG